MSETHYILLMLFKTVLYENHWGVGEGERIKSRISPCRCSELGEEQDKVVSRLGPKSHLYYGKRKVQEEQILGSSYYL